MFQCYLFINITPVSIFLLFLLYNDEYFEYLQPYKKMKTKELYSKTMVDKLGLLKRIVIIQ